MAQTIDLDNPEFQDIWKLISYTRQSVFMTGKAGTGKSTFLRYIVENTKKKTVVLAPTGIAAVNAGGVTLQLVLPPAAEAVAPRRSGANDAQSASATEASPASSRS